MICYGLTSGSTDSNWKVISCWGTSSWESNCCWTILVTISLGLVLMSLGNCETSSSETDVPEMVGVTRVLVLIEIDDLGNPDEELGVLDVLDSVKQDRFDWIGVASCGKGSLLIPLCKWQGKGWCSSTIADYFYYQKRI